MDKNLIKTVKAVQKGDEKAFEALYNEYAKPTHFLALKLMKDERDAEEVTQDAFVTAFRKIGELRNPEAFPSWLNKITVNKCTDALKKNSALMSAGAEETAEVAFIEETDRKLIPDKALDDEATAQLLVEIIDKLPLPQRVCVYYYYYEDFSVREIAEQLAVQETTVRNRLALARDKIRKELERLENKEGLKLYMGAPLILIPALKLAAQHSEIPANIVSKIFSALGLEATATAATATTVTTATTTTVTTAKAAVSAKTIAAVVGGVVVTGGVITGVVLANPPEPEAIPAIEETVQSTEAITEPAPTEPPATTLAATEPPETTPAATEPPETEPPETEPPATEPPETAPPEPENTEVRITRAVTNESLKEAIDSGAIPANVTHLTLTYGGSPLTDITPLEKLKNLEYLCLSSTGVTEIAPLANLSNLTELNLGYVSIPDFSQVSQLTNLTALTMFETKTADLTLLANMKNLTYLDLRICKITDVSPLASLTNLTYLDLSNNRLTDISPLANLKNLTCLKLERGSPSYGITDFTPLASLTNLTELDLGGQNITDASALSGLTKLTDLDIYNQNLTDFSPLKNLKNLRTLRMGFGNGTKFTKEQQKEIISELQAALPDCDIRI